MSRWGNSKELTRASYDLVKQNPDMYRWTVRAGVYGALVGGIGFIIGIFLSALGGVLADPSEGADLGVLGWIVLALGVLCIVFASIAGLTVANLQLAGLVKTADDVLHGRPTDTQAARDASHGRLGTLAVWSSISVAVGALVSFIQGDGDSGIIVTLLRGLLAGMVAAIWSVVTTLVMPLIVLEGLTAVPAIKRSAGIIRSTWGEAVLGSVRIGFRFMLMFTLPGIVLLVGGIVLSIAIGGAAIAVGVGAALVGVVLIIIGAVKAATCRTVFGVALYRWTEGEGALGPFSEDDLRGAVRTKKGSMASV
ncbi:MAG: DUF6159 family protein [Acidimicrobiales bacterium]